jgi:hypothetical protein
MKRFLRSGILVLLFALTNTQARSLSGNIDVLFAIPGLALDANAALNGERVNTVNRPERVERLSRGAEFVVSIFDRDIIKEFSKAWQQSGNGTTNYESVVLIFRMAGGRYMAKGQGSTNERRSFTFRWHPGAIAIIHTHPNDARPTPQGADCQIADKYGVPIFTITLRGMYVYDPFTKKTTRLKEGLDWLDPSSWLRQ